MFDKWLNKILKKKEEKPLPFFRDLPPNVQESVISNYTFFIFERFMETLSIVTIIKSFYIAGIKNENKFGYKLEEGEHQPVLKILLHQILQCILQIYINSVVYKYFRSFYLYVYINPTIKNNQPVVNYDKLVSMNKMFNLLDISITSMPMFRLFEERNKNALKLDRVLDINEVAVKMFSYTESMITTFSKEVVQNSINVFIRDYFNALKEYKNDKLVCSFIAIYAVFFNERFSRIFYTKDDILKIYQSHMVTAEVLIAVSIYDLLIQDINDGNIDFNNVPSSFVFKEEEKVKNFHINVKKEIGVFIDRVAAVKRFIEESKNNVPEVSHQGVNVIDISSVFQKQQKLANINKELDDIKGKL